jgi:hypothetical protein
VAEVSRATGGGGGASETAGDGAGAAAALWDQGILIEESELQPLAESVIAAAIAIAAAFALATNPGLFILFN